MADTTTVNIDERRARRLFLTPAVVILLFLSIFPLIFSLGISFTDAQMSRAEGVPTVLTLDNYARLFRDERLWFTVRNTLVYVVGGVALQYVLGFGLALLLNQEIKGRRLFRTIFLLPMMMTPVAAAYAGRMMFNESLKSPLSFFLYKLGLMDPTSPIMWRADAGLAPVTIILIDTWQWSPFIILIMLAGLQSISVEIYEAARVDGANTWKMFWRITFPLMLPLSVTVILIRALEIFKIIDSIVVVTGGGPGSATESVTMYVFDTALTYGNLGYASAVAYLLLLMVIIFTTLFLLTVRRIMPGR